MFEINEEKYWNHLDIFFVIVKFCQMCGIELSSETVKNVYKNPHIQFSSVDITQFFPIVKYPAVLDYYSGKHLMEKVHVLSFLVWGVLKIIRGEKAKIVFNKLNSSPKPAKKCSLVKVLSLNQKNIGI